MSARTAYEHAKAVPDLPKPEPSPLVVGVAIRDPEKHVWSMRSPSRHHHLIHAIVEATSIECVPGDWEQGFMSSNGNFLTRTEALWLVCNNGQFHNELEPGKTELYSEDVW